MSTSAIRKKIKSSQSRQGGYGGPSIFSRRAQDKIERDVAQGRLPKSMLNVTITFSGRQPKRNKPKPTQAPEASRAGTGLAGKLLRGLKSIVGG